MKINLQRIPVNLQQSIIWSQQPEVINTICAITHERRNLLVIMAGFQNIQDDIIAACGLDKPKVIYGDHFDIDTWDNRVSEYLKRAYEEEQKPKDFTISWAQSKLHRQWKTVKARSAEEAIAIVKEDTSYADGDEFLHCIEASDFREEIEKI